MRDVLAEIVKRAPILAAIIGVVVGFGAGAFVGVQRLWAVLLPVHETETAANLDFTLEQLVWLRSGKEDRALSFMEQRLDAAVLGLAANREVSELPSPARQSLLAAKLYREVFPLESGSDATRAVLSQLPGEAVDPASCSPAVRYLLARSAGE
jgi:hypothetical protein